MLLLTAVLELDVTVDETAIGDISEAETRIESTFEDFIKSLLSNSSEQAEHLLSDLAPLLKLDKVTTIVRKQQGIGVYFLCKSGEALKQVQEFDRSKLKEILKNLFTEMLQAETPVEFKRFSFSYDDEPHFPLCQQHYFQRVEG